MPPQPTGRYALGPDGCSLFFLHNAKSALLEPGQRPAAQETYTANLPNKLRDHETRVVKWRHVAFGARTDQYFVNYTGSHGAPLIIAKQIPQLSSYLNQYYFQKSFEEKRQIAYDLQAVIGPHDSFVVWDLDTVYCKNVPQDLAIALEEWNVVEPRKSPNRFVALGADGSYFAKSSTGSVVWHASGSNPTLHKLITFLSSNDVKLKGIKAVFLNPAKADSYVVVMHDSYTHHNNIDQFDDLRQLSLAYATPEVKRRYKTDKTMENKVDYRKNNELLQKDDDNIVRKKNTSELPTPDSSSISSDVRSGADEGEAAIETSRNTIRTERHGESSQEARLMSRHDELERQVYQKIASRVETGIVRKLERDVSESVEQRFEQKAAALLEQVESKIAERYSNVLALNVEHALSRRALRQFELLVEERLKEKIEKELDVEVSIRFEAKVKHDLDQKWKEYERDRTRREQERNLIDF